MSPLDHIRIPAGLYRLKLTSVAELSILGLAASFNGKGLTLSNNTLGELLKIDRRSVYRAIGRLKENGLIQDLGTGKKRRLEITNKVETVLSLADDKDRDRPVPTDRDRSVYELETDLSPIKNKGIRKEKARTPKPKKTLGQNDPKESFDRFWKAYPKRKAKQDAVKAWLKIKPTPELLDKILTALEIQSHSPDWTKDGGRFVPYPATWLNGERWTDEIDAGTPVADDSGCVMTREIPFEEADKLLRDIGYYDKPVEIETKFEGVPG